MTSVTGLRFGGEWDRRQTGRLGSFGQRTERPVTPEIAHSPERVNDGLRLTGWVDPNVVSQAACLAVSFLMSLGKEKLVKVRGPKTESSQQSMGSVLPSGTNTSAKSRCFGVRCDDDNPSDHELPKSS